MRPSRAKRGALIGRTGGGAVALALDLSLRARSDSRVTLDDYMRAMWRVHGKPGGDRPGYVERSYTIADAEARLAEVSGDPSFAREFFARYVRGRDLYSSPHLTPSRCDPCAG